jgi:S-disulfanyl-L-cysteine oxidoreductase SoxD
MQRTFLLFAAMLVASNAAVSRHAVEAQAERTTAAGVYSDAQAKRGQQVYTDTCAMCHGADLMGNATTPGLTGPEFEGFWRGQPLGDLYEKVSVTMPKTAPGSLKPEQSADAVAYLLSMLKEPAGQAELPAKPEELKTIKIAPKP